MPPVVGDIILFLIQLLVVPLILIAMLYLSVHMVFFSVGSEPHKVSRFLALIFGLIVFVLFVVLQLSASLPSGSSIASAIPTSGNPYVYVAGGFVAGLVIMALVHSLIKTRALPIFIIILTSTSLITFYLYGFIGQSRDPIILSSISLLGGAVLYGIVFPDIFIQLRIQDLMKLIAPLFRRRKSTWGNL